MLTENFYITYIYTYIMGFVNIIVHDETRDELSKLKTNPRDSYNDVIVKLIEEYERSRKE